MNNYTITVETPDGSREVTSTAFEDMGWVVFRDPMRPFRIDTINMKMEEVEDAD